MPHLNICEKCQDDAATPCGGLDPNKLCLVCREEFDRVIGVRTRRYTECTIGGPGNPFAGNVTREGTACG